MIVMTNELNTTLYVIYFVNHKGAFNVLCLQSYNCLSAWDHVQSVVESGSYHMYNIFGTLGLTIG